MTSRFSALAVTIGLSVAIAACGGSAETSAPAEPPPIPSGADGATVYAFRCASCHGADLRGTSTGPSQLSIVYEPNHHGDNSYRAAIRNGVPQHHWGFGDMPVIDDITDEQIELVIGYIRGQQAALGFER